MAKKEVKSDLEQLLGVFAQFDRETIMGAVTVVLGGEISRQGTIFQIPSGGITVIPPIIAQAGGGPVALEGAREVILSNCVPIEIGAGDADSAWCLDVENPSKRVSGAPNTGDIEVIIGDTTKAKIKPGGNIPRVKGKGQSVKLHLKGGSGLVNAKYRFC